MARSKNAIERNNNGANLGFEEKLWASASKTGQADELKRQLLELARSQNKAQKGTSIPATFMRVGVKV